MENAQIVICHGQAKYSFFVVCERLAQFLSIERPQSLQLVALRLSIAKHFMCTGELLVLKMKEAFFIALVYLADATLDVILQALWWIYSEPVQRDKLLISVAFTLLVVPRPIFNLYWYFRKQEWTIRELSRDIEKFFGFTIGLFTG